jgi:bifunctional DNA-binding transcriptional regulator/antitoxin component of YhaV-PrlF toxin-antitoxin module
LGIKAGDRLAFEVIDDALVLRLRPPKPSERLRGLGRDAWQGIDPVDHVRTLREASDRTA